MKERTYIAICQSLVKPSIKFTETFTSTHKNGYAPIIQDLKRKTDESDLEIKKDYEIIMIERVR